MGLPYRAFPQAVHLLVTMPICIDPLSTAAHWLVVLAYRHANASLIAPYGYFQLIWAGLFGFAVFGSLPDALTLTGAGIIAASGLYTAYRERARKSTRSPTPDALAGDYDAALGQSPSALRKEREA